MSRKVLIFIFISLNVLYYSLAPAQVFYNNALGYGLRKLNPSYSGSAIQVRRSCDDATTNIGFTSCGHLDTTALRLFILVPNPLTTTNLSTATAFSLRRLICTYSGSAIQVRRSSDNTTQNIGFTSLGDLDTAALKTFVGAGSGFVTTWYDQSGNGRDATQPTAGSQPRIVNVGVVEHQNGKPAIRWLGLSYSLRTASFTAFSTAACFTGVAKVNSNNSYNAIANKCSNNYPAPLDFYSGQIVIGSGTGSTYTFHGFGQTFDASKPLGIWTYQSPSSGTANFFYNGTGSGSGTISYYADNGTPLYLGSRNDGVTGLDGWIAEVITFPALPSTADRQFLEWSQAQYYSISGPTFPTTWPAFTPSAYVATWYDQSGNNRHISQTTTSRQPLLMSAGIIQKTGTKPAVVGTNTLQTNLTVNLGTSHTSASLTAVTVFRPDANTGSATNLRVMSVETSTGTSTSDWSQTSTFNVNQRNSNEFHIERSSSTSSPITCNAGTPMILSVVFNGSVHQMFNNGTGSSTASDNMSFNFSHLRLLQSLNWTYEAGEAVTGRMAEYSMFFSTLSTTRRRLIESNEAAYYNMSIANSKYSPPAANSYNLYVNGMGREASNDTVLGTRLTAGMGVNVTNSSQFIKDDGDYITFGMECPICNISTSNLPATVVQRWINDWYVNKNDAGSNGGNLNMFFDFGDYGTTTMPGVAANYVLLYRNSTASNFTIVPGTSVSTSGDRVIFTVPSANITTNYYYTIGTMSVTPSPLPVELTEFTADVCEQEVCLGWTTASEINNDYFTVERSADGSTWADLVQVDGAGNSYTTKHYSVIDHKPLSGISYYRLRQTDFDGHTTHTPMESVEFKGQSDPLIFPNPTEGFLTVSHCTGYDKLIITDVLGNQIFSAPVNRETMLLDLQSLPDGPLFIILTGKDSKQPYSAKLIKAQTGE